MSQFEEYIYHVFATTISVWPAELTRTIYAISFYLDTEEDDTRRSTITLGYNTYQQWQASTPAIPNHPTIRWPIASDVHEAKWNYAFWLQNSAAEIATSYNATDERGIRLRREWIEEQRLWYRDAEAEADFDAAMAKAEQIQQQFAKVCVSVAQRLHANGVIRTTFGHTIPILIHELEYYDEIAMLTRAANPSGAAQEFENWIDSL